jgi:hypothetical protein
MPEMRKLNDMADQLLHEQLQHTNKYKEMCAHILRQDNVLLKEIGEIILDQESKDLVLDWKAKPEEEARSWKEECAKANNKLKVTTTKPGNEKGKLKHVIHAIEVYKQSVEQLIIYNGLFIHWKGSFIFFIFIFLVQRGFSPYKLLFAQHIRNKG